jgi:hypothetical protein
MEKLPQARVQRTRSEALLFWKTSWPNSSQVKPSKKKISTEITSSVW